MPYIRTLANSASKGFVLAAAFLCVQGLAYSQGGQQTPFLNVDACIALPSANQTGRTWKHGEPEQRDYIRASTTKDAKARIESLAAFSTRYPDSDYRDTALILRLGAEAEVGNWDDLASDSRKILRSPTAGNAALQVGAYNYLADALFHIKADDFSVYIKIAEVDWTVRCGREALHQLKAGPGSRETVQAVASSAEFVFAMAQAQASLLGNDEASALRESSAALQMKPTDYRSNYLFALAMLRSESPDDFQRGIFHLARASSLSPGDDSLRKSVVDVYKAYHGSDKGLDKVLQLAGANASPPSGFHVEPQHAKNHHMAKVAVGLAIAALLGYAIARDPQATVQTLADMGNGSAGTSSRTSARVLVFGGEGHKTYLGCLSCPPGAEDSLYARGGSHDSQVSDESIWNKSSQFGSAFSQYSACNSHASDPPVIVDEDGTYFGRLTLNRYHEQIGIGTRYYGWLHDSVCD